MACFQRTVPCHSLASVHMAQCPTPVNSSQEPVMTQLVRIKDCWRLFGLMEGIINITGAWQEVTNYIKSSWEKTYSLRPVKIWRGFGENKSVTANVPCREHISTGSMWKWFNFYSLQLLAGLIKRKSHFLYAKSEPVLRCPRCVRRGIQGPELRGREVKFGANMWPFWQTLRPRDLEVREAGLCFRPK
jgi:hypothetical protein